MNKQVFVRDVEYGDVIMGPDGRSTVTCIQQKNNFFKLDFAEGRGNRCWSGLLSVELVTRLQKTKCNVPTGFAVNHNGNVFVSYIAEVEEIKENFFFTMADGSTKMIPKNKISYITGNFKLKIVKK